MKRIPVPWPILTLLVLVVLATAAIAVGTRLDLRKARQGAKSFEAQVDSTKAAREAAEARLDSLKDAHAIAAAEAITIIATADTARRETEARRRRASARARELAQGNTEIIEQLDILDSNYDRLAIAFDSVRVQYRLLDFRYDALEETSDTTIAAAKRETLAEKKRADYWEETAIDALSKRDFDLFAWIPTGPLRTAVKGLACGGLGLGVGLLANASEDRPPNSGSNTAAIVGGVGAAGSCVVATIAF